LLLGYAWYHFSGTKQIVTTAKTVLDSANQTKEKIKQATPSTDAALKFLRSTAKTYAAAIPGGAYMIDQSFDQLEKLAESHGEQVKQIVTDSYSQLQDTLASAKGKDAGDAVLAVINDAVGKLKELGSKIDQDVIGPFLEKNPQLQKALEGSQDQLKEIMQKQGPEAKRIRDDTYKQLSGLVAAGLTGDSIQKAVALIQQKSTEVSKLASQTGADAWEAASKNAQPLLNKLPDVKKMLDEQLPKMQGVIGEDGVKQVQELYEKLAELGKDAKNKDPKELAKEAKKLVEERMASIQKSTSGTGKAAKNTALSYLEQIPGVKDLPELHAFKTIVEKHGKDAEKLMDATYEDLKKILSKRLEEAKKLGDSAKEETKDKVKEKASR